MTPPPTPTEYIRQAKHNLELAKHLREEKPDYLDWAVTCLFYAAVHYINAYLSHSKIAIPRRHRGEDGKPGRLNIVQQDSTLKAIYANYRHLDDESRDARYELRVPTKSDYDNILMQQLKAIQNYILPKVPSP